MLDTEEEGKIIIIMVSGGLKDIKQSVFVVPFHDSP